ncbi:MAG: hydroxyacid dehydrogenase [Desulfobacteraceae bacterium]|jgi:phosphonate dehydrogenase|nr:MAG: hydroxyacid dehydrogenase [Desulfobacteraceae bacterium]
MKGSRIVITHRVHPEIMEELSRYGSVFANEGTESLGPEVLREKSAGAEALMVFMPDRIDEPFLACCPKLKIVACALKGYDNIDVEACAGRGIWVSIVPDLLSAPTADLAVALLLALTRNIVQGDREIRSGAFRGWRPVLYGSGLPGKKAGIVGFGRVGRLIARRLIGFDLIVSFFDPNLKEDKSPVAVNRTFDLDELIRESDYLILAAPLGPASFHLFDKERLGKVKPGAFMVNVGRGSVVDEGAVAEALAGGRLSGYAADVFEMEDLSLPNRPTSITQSLLDAPDRTVFTPHLGSAVAEVRLAIERAAAASIIDVLEGRRPGNAVS